VAKSTEINPKDGFHFPSAMGESSAKNMAVDNRSANIVQN
jgi:hypothetical protein